MSDGVYGRRQGELMGVDAPPTLALRLFERATFALTRIRFEKEDDNYIPPLPREDAYLVHLQLGDVPEHPYWLAGRHVTFPEIRAGQFGVFNLNLEHASCLPDPMDCLCFYVSRAALDGIADEHNAPRITTLHPPPVVLLDDVVVRGLGSSLMPALERPEQANRLFLDSVALAFLTHVAQTYGELQTARSPRLGGLAEWQERRVKEALLASIDGSVSLERLANLVGLSRSHFARAFKASTGMPPHRWLLARRIERTEDLLLHTGLPIEDIAARGGFADHSHFTRTFYRMTGMSPREWRRRRRM